MARLGSKPDGAGAYNRRLHRMREVEALVGLRFGKVIPVGADADPYLAAIAFAANAMGAPLEPVLVGWCRRFAPHLADRVPEILPPIRLQVDGRRYDLNDNDVAELLRVTFAERQKLGLRTIGVADISADEMKARVKAARRERERQRIAEKRAGKARSRAEYLAMNNRSRERPWEAAGMSRAKWYRLQKQGETSLLQGSQCQGETGPLQIGNLPCGATDLSHAATAPSIAPSIDDLAPDGGGRVKRPSVRRAPPLDKHGTIFRAAEHEAAGTAHAAGLPSESLPEQEDSDNAS